EAAVPDEAPRLLVILANATPHGFAAERPPVIRDRLEDPATDTLAAKLGQHSHHRVETALDRRRPSDTAAESLVPACREQERALLIRPDEVLDLVEAENVARDPLQDLGPLRVLPRRARPLEAQLHA